MVHIRNNMGIYEEPESGDEQLQRDISVCYHIARGLPWFPNVLETPQEVLNDIISRWEEKIISLRDRAGWGARGKLDKDAEFALGILEDYHSKNNEKDVEAPMQNGVAKNMDDVAKALAQKMSSPYISAQVDLMLEMRDENPTEAIGKSKEFIESCCKTILERHKADIDKNWNVNKLVKKTIDVLESTVIDKSDVPESRRNVRAFLHSLSGLVCQIAELRNGYGSGHGRSASYVGLTARHARLAVHSSVTLVEYLWDTHELRKEEK